MGVNASSPTFAAEIASQARAATETSRSVTEAEPTRTRFMTEVMATRTRPVTEAKATRAQSVTEVRLQNITAVAAACPLFVA